MTLTLEQYVEAADDLIAEEVLPQVGGLCIDIGTINELLMAKDEMLNTISTLEESHRQLKALIDGGVDNWDGYDIAMETLW